MAETKVVREAWAVIREELGDAVKENILTIARARIMGKISDEQFELLLEDVVEDVVDATENALDVMIELPSPGEELTDAVIGMGADALRPKLGAALLKGAGALKELFDRDAPRLLKRIQRAQEAGREKRTQRLARILERNFPQEAKAAGWTRRGREMFYNPPSTPAPAPEPEPEPVADEPTEDVPG